MSQQILQNRLEQKPAPPLAIIPLAPFPHGCPRAVASFVEVGIQPQLPRLLQGTDDVQQGPQQRLLLVLNAMLGA